MASIALIGPDGAGKTTLTRMLERSEALPIRSVYMGVAISSSNFALPTTRFVEWLKHRGGREVAAAPAANGNGIAVNRKSGVRAKIRATARLLNRLIEEWYRQFVSWIYQFRGFVVLYDRHFVFDYAPEITSAQRETLEQRLHRWLLTYCYPRPDLVIFLDAPGEVLFARKGELTVAELERRRQAFLRQGERYSNFVCIDATQPLASVHDQVLSHILRVRGERHSRSMAAAQ